MKVNLWTFAIASTGHVQRSVVEVAEATPYPAIRLSMPVTTDRTTAARLLRELANEIEESRP